MVDSSAIASLVIRTAPAQPIDSCDYVLAGFASSKPIPRLLDLQVLGESTAIRLSGTTPGLTSFSLGLSGRLMTRTRILMASRQFAEASVGHHGAGFLWPENTLVSLRAAMAATLQATEVDVRLTRDTVPVLIHDPTVNRTTTGQGSVESLSLAQIQMLDAGVKFDPLFIGTRVPTLEEALRLTAASGHHLYLDVKPQTLLSPGEEALLLVDLIIKTNSVSNATILCNSTAFLTSARAASSVVALGLVTGAYRGWQRPFVKSIHGSTVLFLFPDSLLAPAYREGLDSLTRSGIRVLVGTLNDPVLADSILNVMPLNLVLTDFAPLAFRMGRPRTADSLP